MIKDISTFMKTFSEVYSQSGMGILYALLLILALYAIREVKSMFKLGLETLKEKDKSAHDERVADRQAGDERLKDFQDITREQFKEQIASTNNLAKEVGALARAVGDNAKSNDINFAIIHAKLDNIKK